MRSHTLLAAMSCVASLVLLPPARVSLAAEPCGAPALTLEDLNTLARDAALANRVAPHSLHLRDEQLRSTLISLRERATHSASTTAPLGFDSKETWQPGFGLPGLHEYPGAAIEFRGELIVSGWLYSAGPHRVIGIARWTENGWEPLGDGIIPGFALAVLDDRLYAGEWTGRVSVWDGESWTRLPQSPLMNLRALVVHKGALYAAGSHGTTGLVVRLDGRTWQVLGGDFDAEVAALGAYRGELIAGGNFRSYQGAPCGYVARWSGTTWEAIGSGIDVSEYSGVSAIEEFGDRLIVGGWFSSCGPVATPGLAAWDGASWSALPGAPAAYVYDLLVKDAHLYIAGSFAGDYSAVARWDGANWTPEGLEPWVLGLASYRGQLTAVGGFYGASCPDRKRITGVATLGPDGWSGFEKWDDWMHGLAANVGSALASDAVVYGGDLVVAGTLGLAGSPPEWKAISSPVRWDGHDWQRIGDGGPCPTALAVVGNDLIGGGFYGVARWDGAAWHSMGSGLSGFFCAIAEYQGKTYAGGELRIGATGQNVTLASFDGVEWSAVPFAPNTALWNTPRVSALEVKDGLLYVGGNFDGAQSVASPSIVAWDGQRWRGVGGGVRGDIGDLESFDGDLYVGGAVSRDEYGYEGVLRWDGMSWSSLGLADCQVLALGRYGDKLVVSGNMNVDRFVPGSIGLVSWDGQTWGGFETGVNGQIQAIQQVGDDLYVAGSFSYAGDHSSFSVARWSGDEPPPTPIPIPTPTPTPIPQPPTVDPEPPGALAVRSALVTSNQARLSFSLPAAGYARLELYDVRGALVATLCDGAAVAGTNLLEWSSGSPAPFPENGVYFLRITSHGQRANAKVVFAR